MRSVLQLCSFTFSALGAVLVHIKLTRHVVIVASLAAAVTSYIEFTGLSRKIVRYTGVVRGLKNLLSRWNALGDVERAVPGTISNFITAAECIITDEHKA